MGLLKSKIKYVVSLVFIGFSIYLASMINVGQALSGSDWRAGRIIDDSLFTNKNAMSVPQIQSFLESKVPVCDTNGTQMIGSITRAQYGINNGNPPPFTCLKEYYENPETKASNYGGQPIPSGAKSAAQLIWEAAQQHNINPQVLIITLQKEQGLITDDWPFKRQYEKAMGAHCPDTAPCDPAYASFSAQMLEGAELFRYYLDNMNQPWWPYAKPGNRSILYNPNSACGSSNVFIENYATAALYTYTPYQPNTAALNNLFGTGDSCSAYGNRNFWRDFNNWFGPSTSLGYTLAIADNGDPRQWVIMNGKRYYVTPEIKQALGLPDTPITWDDLYLGSFPDAPIVWNGAALSRLIRPAGTLNIYFAADGKRYRIPTTQMLDIWNLSTMPVLDVSSGFGEVPLDSGDLTYTAKLSSGSAVYLIDSGLKRHILSSDVLKAFAGDTPYVNVFTATNDAYFNNLSSGAAIGNPKITDGSWNYIVDSARKLQLDSTTANLYPTSWGANSVTPAIFNYFGTQPITYLIRAWDSPDVYLIDQGSKHLLIDPSVLDAWASATFPSSVTVTTRGLRDLIPNGASISDYFASYSGNKYVIDKAKRSIPSVLQNAYTSTRTVYAASDVLLSVFPAANEVTGFVRPAGYPDISLLTNGGIRRNFVNHNRLRLWTQNHLITDLRPANVDRYGYGGGLNAFVSDGTTNYLMADGVKHVIDNNTKNNWGLGTPDTLDATTLAFFVTSTAITNDLQNNGTFFLIHQGTAYGTIDSNIANMWSVDDGPVMDTALISEFLHSDILTRVARSKVPGDTRLFIVNYGNLYRLYPNHASNLNASGPFTWIDPSVFTVFDWTAVAVKDEGGTHYVIDAGTKRLMPAGLIRSQWTNGGTANVPTMNNGFLNTLPTTIQIERTIKGSGPNIYAADNLAKRWIQNPNTYSSSYAPYTFVSDALLSSMPDGNPI